jgi:hypothetical protein
MEQQEVEVIINRVLAKSKESYKVKQGTFEPYFEFVPDYYEGYKKAVNQMRRISPHADVDVFPEMLFNEPIVFFGRFYFSLSSSCSLFLF